MEIIRHIKVDLYGDTQHFAVAAKQMDMGTRYIGVTLMEDGVVYEIPDNVEVIINMTNRTRHTFTTMEKSPEMRLSFLSQEACCRFTEQHCVRCSCIKMVHC